MGTPTNFPFGIQTPYVVGGGGSAERTTGNVFFVDSGSSGAKDSVDRGSGPGNPFLTVDFAVGRCTANNGDVIYVMPGHNETLGADGADVDVAGVSVIGMGTGADKPTFDFDATTGELVIGAANVRLHNLRFRTSIAAVVNAINIEAAGDNFVIDNCDFGFAETSGTDDFADAIIVEAGANDGVIQHCLFDAEDATAVSAIELNGAVIGITIQDNTFHGDYSTAIIRGDTTLSEFVVIRRNLMWNGVTSGLNAQPVIELLTGTVGTIIDNDIACNVASPNLAIICDGAFMMGNRYQETPSAIQGGVINADSQPAAARMMDGQNPMGNNIYVAASGGSDGALPQGYDPKFPLATVKQAITNGIAGDTIVLGPGTHSIDTSSAALVPIAGLTFQGAVPSHGGRPQAVLTQSADAGAVMVLLDVDDVVFRDITFLLVAGGCTAITLVDMSQTASADNCSFINCWFDLNDVDAAVMAISVDDPTILTVGLTVNGCRFTGGSGTTNGPIYVNIGVLSIYDSVFERCIFGCESVSDDCIAFSFGDPGGASVGYGWVIRDCDIIGPTDGAVTLVPFLTPAGSSGEYTGIIRTNYFAHTNVAAIPANQMDECLVRNYVGDLTVGGTILDSG